MAQTESFLSCRMWEGVLSLILLFSGISFDGIRDRGSMLP